MKRLRYPNQPPVEDSGFRIGLKEIPIIAASLVILLGVLFWYRAQNAQNAAINSTNITLAALQTALVQYEQTTGALPPSSACEPKIRSFLDAYQRIFVARNQEGQWELRFCALIYLDPTAAVKGWITMPDGSRYYGVVGANDGCGLPIKYLPNGDIHHAESCFAADIPTGPGQVLTIYSSN
jgi:hypothetical protein